MVKYKKITVISMKIEIQFFVSQNYLHNQIACSPTVISKP